nr:MAG TPA: hypothetical protein [Bacteriophage sp.]
MTQTFELRRFPVPAIQSRRVTHYCYSILESHYRSPCLSARTRYR